MASSMDMCDAPALPDGAWTDDDTDIEWVYVGNTSSIFFMIRSATRMAAIGDALCARSLKLKLMKV